MPMGAVEPSEINRTCNSKDCDLPATKLSCPKCVALKIPSYFCSQACFNTNWKIHKSIHKRVKNELDLSPKRASLDNDKYKIQTPKEYSKMLIHWLLYIAYDANLPLNYMESVDHSIETNWAEITEITKQLTSGNLYQLVVKKICDEDVDTEDKMTSIIEILKKKIIFNKTLSKRSPIQSLILETVDWDSHQNIMECMLKMYAKEKLPTNEIICEIKRIERDIVLENQFYNNLLLKWIEAVVRLFFKNIKDKEMNEETLEWLRNFKPSEFMDLQNGLALCVVIRYYRPDTNPGYRIDINNCEKRNEEFFSDYCKTCKSTIFLLSKAPFCYFKIQSMHNLLTVFLVDLFRELIGNIPLKETSILPKNENKTPKKQKVSPNSDYLRGKLYQMSKENTELKKENNMLRTENGVLKGTNETTIRYEKEKCIKMKEEISVLQKKNQSLQKTLNSLQLKGKPQHDDVSETRKDVQYFEIKLKQKTEELERNRAEFEIKLAELKSELDETKKSYSQCSAELTSAKHVYNDLLIKYQAIKHPVGVRWFIGFIEKQHGNGHKLSKKAKKDIGAMKNETKKNEIRRLLWIFMLTTQTKSALIGEILNLIRAAGETIETFSANISLLYAHLLNEIHCSEMKKNEEESISKSEGCQKLSPTDPCLETIEILITVFNDKM